MKVRIKELAQEAKFIRLEETKVKARKVFIRGKFGTSDPSYSDLCTDFWWLNSHRKVDVREAARAAQLAYSFLRGVPYSVVEGKRKPEKEYRFNYYIKPEVKRLVKKFGKLWNNENCDAEIETWLKPEVDIN
ncbi:MAG: hypothetical protein QN632_08705 [Nitrososphaeraceae archaeon]|nr:hypothetical protein [Nitrososphaeraceae archaeon]